MLFYFLYPLKNTFFAFNVFNYISFRATGAAITALLISFFLGPKIIRTLEFYQIGETIRKHGPKSHLKKEGTPTMGGIIVLLAIILPTILWAKLDNKYILLILASTIWMGLIGFMDDYLKVVKKYPSGLIAKYKLIGQILLSITIAYFVIQYPAIQEYSNSTSIPFIANGMIDITWFYPLLIIIVITGTSNAVNITDGLDGLATGLVAISTLVFAAIAYATGRLDYSNYLNIIYLPNTGELFIFCLSMIGACIGFLWFNANPAKVFMGDTGSLAIGAALGTLAVLVKKEILLILIGGVFVVESISVILQVYYFKYTKNKFGKGKKLFLMAPLHHHFELSGWHENHVVVRFWIIGVLLALISLTTFKIQ
tara:strand:+ start:286 stop:1389 length:1104 start_codon:yes stop_codon:yes gene_type:complete